MIWVPMFFTREARLFPTLEDVRSHRTIDAILEAQVLEGPVEVPLGGPAPVVGVVYEEDVAEVSGLPPRIRRTDHSIAFPDASARLVVALRAPCPPAVRWK